MGVRLIFLWIARKKERNLRGKEGFNMFKGKNEINEKCNDFLLLIIE